MDKGLKFADKTQDCEAKTRNWNQFDFWFINTNQNDGQERQKVNAKTLKKKKERESLK